MPYKAMAHKASIFGSFKLLAIHAQHAPDNPSHVSHGDERLVMLRPGLASIPRA